MMSVVSLNRQKKERNQMPTVSAKRGELRTSGMRLILAGALFAAASAMLAGEALLISAPAMAQGMADVASGLRTDPDAPIEIEADQLDIFDQKKVAVFKGSVRARQGEQP